VATGEERLGEERLPEVTALAVSSDGTWAATALFTEARVWDVATGAVRCRVTRHHETTSSVAIDPDGHVVSMWDRGVEDGRGVLRRSAIVVWDPATGETLRTQDGDDSDGAGRAVGSSREWKLPGTIDRAEIRDVAVAPDGARIAGAHRDGTVRLWTKEGAEVMALRGHAAEVKAVAWSDDGRWIFSGGEDAFVRVWDAASGMEADLIPVDGGPEMLVFRKGRLYVGCANRTVCVYEWKPPE